MSTNLIKHQGFAPTTFSEARQFAEELSCSSLIPKTYIGKPADILVAMQWGSEIGLAPMQALQNIAVINGRPSLFGDAMLALVQASPLCQGIEEFIDDSSADNPVAVCIAKRKDRADVTAKFSKKDAEAAKLTEKQGPWQQYLHRMLQMRARGFALRDQFPDVLKGLISSDEAEDYPEEVQRVEKNITPIPVNPLDAIAPPGPIQNDVEIEIVDHAHELPATTSWALMYPGQDDPHKMFDDKASWSAAYETVAETIYKSHKILARDKMTKLRELREANFAAFEQMDMLDTLPHKQRYQDRLRFLATQKDPGEEPGDASAD